MKKIRTTIITMSLITLSLSTLGFSTWLLGGSNVQGNVSDITFGDIVSTDYKDSAYYRMNHEHGIGYYTEDGIGKVTKNTIGFQIVIVPSKIQQYFSNDTYVSFGISYTCSTTNDIDVFSNGIYSKLNNKAVFSLSTNPYIRYFTDVRILKQELNNGLLEYTATINTLLYSFDETSLYSTFEYFGSSSNVFLDVNFSFDVLNDNRFVSEIKKINFSFHSSLKGKQL